MKTGNLLALKNNIKQKTQPLKDHINEILHLADNSLIMGHRLSEWTGHGPVLEQDIALTNIALDLVGQARNFYQYAAQLSEGDNNGNNITEDDLAYLRDEREFKNFLLVELPNNDWGNTILKVFLFSTWQYYFYKFLLKGSDEQIAAIAEKSLKEIAYHVRWSSEWVIRLGDGTAESHERMQDAIDRLWPYTGEMFSSATSLINNESQSEIKESWMNKVSTIFKEATLEFNEKAFMQQGGKEGIHTEHLGFLLAEMQFLQRAYPGCTW